MIKVITLLLLVLMSVTGRAAEPLYTQADSLRVMGLFSEARRQPVNTDMVLFFARSLCGIPYVAHTLETGKTERLVVNMRQMDCATYVDNVVALTLCMEQRRYTFAAVCDNLRLIRYRAGAALHYTTRLHYFSDWIADNSAKGICRELQSPSPPFTGKGTVNVYYMSANPLRYKALRLNPSYTSAIAASEKRLTGHTYRYIPKALTGDTALMRRAVNDGDIIALTTTLGGLDIHHVGFAVWHKDGLHLLNASSLHRKVVEEPLTIYEYLKKQPNMNGLRIIRLTGK